MIRAALILSLVLLAACDRAQTSGEPFTDPRLPPGLSTRFWPPAGWGWGLIQLKDAPPLRYGVAAPNGEARGDVIILTGHGESAEIWFETARALIERDYAVWILDGAGEGGSGRYGKVRDLGEVPDFEADIRAVIALHRKVMRPRRQTAVIASGTSAVPALAAVQRGFRPAVLILSGPFEPQTKAWKRPEPADRLTPRRRALSAWAVANPDLRMGGVSAGWTKASAKLSGETLAPVSLGRVRTRVVVIAPAPDDLPCAQMPDCRKVVLAAEETYPYSKDDERTPWLAEIFESLPD